MRNTSLLMNYSYSPTPIIFLSKINNQLLTTKLKKRRITYEMGIVIFFKDVIILILALLFRIIIYWPKIDCDIGLILSKQFSQYNILKVNEESRWLKQFSKQRRWFILEGKKPNIREASNDQRNLTEWIRNGDGAE